MSSSYDIQPATKIFTYIITHISIAVQQIILDESAVLAVSMYDAEGMCRDFQNLIMSGDDYKKWETDDYVANWVCQQLGYVLT